MELKIRSLNDFGGTWMVPQTMDKALTRAKDNGPYYALNYVGVLTAASLVSGVSRVGIIGTLATVYVGCHLVCRTRGWQRRAGLK